jgi:hypothetical protein
VRDTPARELADLARRWRGNDLRVFALHLCTFPRLNLSRVVYFGEVECSFTNGTPPRRRARSIKPAVRKVRIAMTITEDAITVAPLALVKRLSFIRS